MLDRVTGMRVFVRVAHLGSFTAAASALGLSPSMATRHVDAIEDRLGARLVLRTTRRLTLTDAGERYRGAAERILAELDEAEAEAAEETSEPRGTLRLNAPVSFGVHELVPALADFAGRYPALTVDLGLTDRYVDLVEEGWDLAIRLGTLRDSPLVAKKLAPVGVALAASPDYLKRRGTPQRLADLQHHNCLGYTLSADGRQGAWHFGAAGEIAQPFTGNLNANNGDALVAAALAGQGIILQPTPLGHVHAVYAPTRHLPAKVRTLIDFLAKRWAGTPPWDRGLEGVA